MGIKRKFKRALAGFFREEILEFLGYTHNNFDVSQSVVYREIPFKVVTMEHILDFSHLSAQQIHDPIHYEVQLQEIRKKFADEVIKHTHIESKEMFETDFYMRRAIRLTLRVQAK